MRTPAVILLLCSLSSPCALSAQLDTLRHVNVIPGGGYSAIWGYTAPNGREYAILGCNGSGGRTPGTSIIDITDNANMRQVAFIGGPASIWREMKTYRHYGYVVSEGGGGVHIINLSQLPDTAWLVRSFNHVNGTKNTLRSHAISIHDGFMYLNGCAGWSPGGMLIFDLRNDPENPQYVGEYQPEYIHDSYVLRDTIYASAINGNGGLYIADATNKASIRQIGKITYPGSGTHNAWVTKNRRYAITTDEIGSTVKNLKFWDISALPAIPS
ncbi:MAG: choice-of-anchor B family protein, partial [Bacteroidota bacterium]